MTEHEALRAYFDAHMAMNRADTEAAFGRAYVQANRARDRLLQLEHEVANELQSGCNAPEGVRGRGNG